MRKRDHSVLVRLTQQELDFLENRVRRSGLSREAYLRALIHEKSIKERPSPDLCKTLTLLQQISNNMNQIARRANAMNFIDTDTYRENAASLEELKGKLLEVMYG
ncbi:MAG: plasmid mobilization relaxosome protein MobC [Clostridia bacterium]|nr:plasmid mobilization relaxosome protein MobC [Clostridia bacterium]